MPSAAKSWTQSRTARSDPAEPDGIDRRQRDQPAGGVPDRRNADAGVEVIDGGKQHAGVEEDIVVGAAPGQFAPLGNDRGGLGRREERDIAIALARDGDAAFHPAVGNRRGVKADRSHGNVLGDCEATADATRTSRTPVWPGWNGPTGRQFDMPPRLFLKIATIR